MSLSLVRWLNMCTAASPADENSVMFGSFRPYLTLPPQRFISLYCLDSIIANILLFIKEGVAKHFKWGGGMSSKCLIYKAKTINFLMQDCLSYSLMFPDATRVETLHCAFVNRLNRIYASMVNLHHCFLSQAQRSDPSIHLKMFWWYCDMRQMLWLRRRRAPIKLRY